MLFANPAYDRLFGGGVLTVGREEDQFLRDDVQRIARRSHEQIIDGCTCVTVDYCGMVGDNGGSRLKMVSLSLLGSGHPTMASLRVSHVASHFGPAMFRRAIAVRRRARRFESLESPLPEIARLVATGRSTREIADKLHLCRRTVRRHTSTILNRLDVGNVIELTLLLNHFQETGLGDFGLPTIIDE